MTDHPILFSGPMVLALLDGRKSQTRRVMNPQPEPGARFSGFERDGHALFTKGCFYGKQRLRYATGDRLWVREAWRTHKAYDDLSPSAMGGEEAIQYTADGALHARGWPTADFDSGRLRASMHMPRWASRLTLRVTEVRVQRLQSITPQDARAEGHPTDWGRSSDPQAHDDAAIDWFMDLWDSLNATRGFGWAENPWVTATSFEVVPGNIDEVK